MSGGGPLAGLKVVEFQGLGPLPHAAMMLSDMGATVRRITGPGRSDATCLRSHTLRGRDTIELDLTLDRDRGRALDMIADSDVLLEGYRPGVMERLGLGPEDCHAVAPGLLYARMTGWGQRGPLADVAGHDINYLALSGTLSAIGTEDAPSVPLNLVADYGGGSMYLVTSVLAALLDRTQHGRVLDVAMVDGVVMLSQCTLELRTAGTWIDQRHSNIGDGGAPFYTVYRCRDGRHLAVGAIEKPFYEAFVGGLGLDAADLPDHLEPASWPELRDLFTQRLSSRSRDEWVEVFEGRDACVTPVLTFAEAAAHPHMRARGVLFDSGEGLVALPPPALAARPEALARSAGDLLNNHSGEEDS